MRNTPPFFFLFLFKLPNQWPGVPDTELKELFINNAEIGSRDSGFLHTNFVRHSARPLRKALVKNIRFRWRTWKCIWTEQEMLWQCTLYCITIPQSSDLCANFTRQHWQDVLCNEMYISLICLLWKDCHKHLISRVDCAVEQVFLYCHCEKVSLPLTHPTPMVRNS